jgi:regulator of replication initiation timing
MEFQNEEYAMRYQDFTDKDNWQQILELCENLDELEKTVSTTQHLKQQAAEYLHTDLSKKLNKQELRSLLAKAEKMKNSNKKEVRSRGTTLAKQIQWLFNLNK